MKRFASALVALGLSFMMAAASSSTAAAVTKPATAHHLLIKVENFNAGFGAFTPYTGGTSVVGVGRTPSQCSVDDGILIESERPDGATCGGKLGDFSRRYGLWEVRMRVFATGTSGSAPHPVMMLWPSTGTDGELDFFETDLYHPAHGYLHCVTDAVENCYVIPDSAVNYKRWHIYAIWWTSQRLTGYIDGHVWWTTTNPSVFPTGTMHPALQLDNLSGKTPARSAQMEIDWVRLYS